MASSERESSSKNAFDTWYLKSFFEFVSKTEKTVTVKCKLCMPLPKTLNAAHNTMSNLKKHLEVRFSRSRRGLVINFRKTVVIRAPEQSFRCIFLVSLYIPPKAHVAE